MWFDEITKKVGWRVPVTRVVRPSYTGIKPYPVSEVNITHYSILILKDLLPLPLTCIYEV